MTDGETSIVALGAITAVGLSVGEVDTSVRSGAARFIESNFRDRHFRPFTVARLPEAAVPPLAPAVDAVVGVTPRLRRVVRLAAAALDQCGPVTARLPHPPAVYLVVPDVKTNLPFDGDQVLDLLGMQSAIRFDRAASKSTFRGRAGGLAAIGAAASALTEGKARAVLVCGADTFIDPFVLGTLDLEGRIKSASNLDGFIPGEGAGAILLLSSSTANEYQLERVVTILAAANGRENGHLYSDEPYRGDGLALTFQTLFASAGDLPPVADVYSTMNGESHWGQEWGVGFVRNRDAFDPNVRIHHPADCFGDTGAASGPLLVALASLALRGGRTPSPALAYASSDYGERSAIVLSRS